MKHIFELFKNTNREIPIDIKGKEIIINFVKKKYKIVLTKDQIKIVQKTIILSVEPVIKQKIKACQRELAQAMKQQDMVIENII